MVIKLEKLRSAVTSSITIIEWSSKIPITRTTSGDKDHNCLMPRKKNIFFLIKLYNEPNLNPKYLHMFNKPHCGCKSFRDVECGSDGGNSLMR